MAPFRYKRKSFEHEKALRFIHYAPTEESGVKSPPPNEFGLRLKVSVSCLIESVHVAPRSPRWFLDLTKTVCGTYAFAGPVRQSTLVTEHPSYGL